MQRIELCERIQRVIYNGFPSDDATITIPLINSYLNDAIGYAAKLNYKENLQLDGIGYVNNSFYATFKGLQITQDDENFSYVVSLPKIPLGIGRNEGISNIVIKDNTSKNVSLDCIPLSQNQIGVYNTMRAIPNKILYYYNNDSLYFKCTDILTAYTANVTMISGSSSATISLTDTINVPDDYIGTITEYILKILVTEKNMSVDTTNDGVDLPK